MPFSTPFHKQLDPSKQAGQVHPGRVEQENLALAQAIERAPVDTDPAHIPLWDDVAEQSPRIVVDQIFGRTFVHDFGPVEDE